MSGKLIPCDAVKVVGALFTIVLNVSYGKLGAKDLICVKASVAVEKSDHCTNSMVSTSKLGCSNTTYTTANEPDLLPHLKSAELSAIEIIECGSMLPAE